MVKEMAHPYRHQVWVYECPKCGRLWVGAWQHQQHGWPSDLLPQDAYFNRLDEEMIRGYGSKHAVPAPMAWANPPDLDAVRERNTCYGMPKPVERPEVLAAFHLSGRDAAQAMFDRTKQDSVWFYVVG